MAKFEVHLIKNGHSTAEVRKYWATTLQRSSAGNGLLQGADTTCSSSWINDPPRFWGGSDYIKAIQLRGNLLPTIGAPYNRGDAAKCRAGCDRVESLSHVLQGCPVTHWPRIRRHDYIVGRLSRAARECQWNAEVEPNIWGTDGVRRKPDLIFKKENQIIICDVAIHWEGPRPLLTSYNAKIDYYSVHPFLQALQQRYPSCEISILPLLISHLF